MKIRSRVRRYKSGAQAPRLIMIIRGRYNKTWRYKGAQYDIHMYVGPGRIN